MQVPSGLEGYEEISVVATSAVSSSARFRRGDHHLFVKRLTSRSMQSEPQIEAFKHEIVLLAALDGRGTPSLVASGSDREGLYLATEWSDFPSLAGRRIDVSMIRSLVDVLAVVSEAEGAGGPLSIVHGDLSPANVLLSRDGRTAFLVDFGLARSRVYHPSPRTFRGTLAYAAPEVARGEAPTHASDIFSLAAVIVHSLTGSPLRPPMPQGALLIDVGENAPDLSPLATLPSQIAETLRACLSFAATDRPRNARDVLATIAVC